ncbi:MAG TPA: hypothetical protein VM912_15235 [Terriglobales bacterium]|nr:hypothetical protein [Terriglobales bacterium]
MDAGIRAPHSGPVKQRSLDVLRVVLVENQVCTARFMGEDFLHVLMGTRLCRSPILTSKKIELHRIGMPSTVTVFWKLAGIGLPAALMRCE